MMKKQQQHGAAMLLFTLFLAFAATALVLGLNRAILSDLRDFNQLVRSKQALLLAEAAVEDTVTRIGFGNYGLDTVETVTLNGVTGIATTTYDVVEDEYRIVGRSSFASVERSSEALVAIAAGSSFNYGLQAGNGGINLSQSATVVGNIYSNGPITGFNRSDIYGDIVSAGPSGYIEDVHATGSVYAYEISDLLVDQDAYFFTYSGATSTILGTPYITPTYQPTSTLPISTTTIQEWKDAITDVEEIDDPTSVCYGGGTYTINVDITIGYVQYECDVEITGNNTDVTLTGPVLVEGNLTFSNGPNIAVDSGLGRRSVQMIAASSTNKTTSSQIDVAQSTSFAGSGDSRSFILLFSENESASLGGSEIAIRLGNSSEGDLLVYAGDGLVDIQQQINITEVTGYQIDIANNSSVTYESGLANVLFTSGPGGAYRLAGWSQIE